MYRSWPCFPREALVVSRDSTQAQERRPLISHVRHSPVFLCSMQRGESRRHQGLPFQSSFVAERVGWSDAQVASSSSSSVWGVIFTRQSLCPPPGCVQLVQHFLCSICDAMNSMKRSPGVGCIPFIRELRPGDSKGPSSAFRSFMRGPVSALYSFLYCAASQESHLSFSISAAVATAHALCQHNRWTLPRWSH